MPKHTKNPKMRPIPKVYHTGRFAGTSIGKDKDGVYCYTHRARSKSYPSKDKIPDKVVKFIESTG